MLRARGLTLHSADPRDRMETEREKWRMEIGDFLSGASTTPGPGKQQMINRSDGWCVGIQSTGSFPTTKKSQAHSFQEL